MQKFLVLGDIHLGKAVNLGKNYIGSIYNSRLNDQIALLDWTLEQAIEHQVESIITTADVFEETKVDAFIFSVFLEWLKKCEYENIRVDIIAGNHDILRHGNIVYSNLDIINHIDLKDIYFHKSTKNIQFDDIGFTFLPFNDRKSLGELTVQGALDKIKVLLEYNVSELNYKKVLIGHMALENSIPIGNEFSDLQNEILIPFSMLKDYDLTIMGHVHKFQQLKPNIYHIGSMDISDFGEQNEEKFLMLISKDDVQKIKIPTRKLTHLNVSIPKDIENATDYLLSQLKEIKVKDSIIRMEINIENTATKSLNKKVIEEYLNHNNIHNIAGFSETRNKEIVKTTVNNDISYSTDVSQAIVSYSKQKYTDDKDISDYISLSTEILESLDD